MRNLVKFFGYRNHRESRPARLIVILAAFFSAAPAYSQVATALTSSGLGTTVSQAGTSYDITGGTRKGGNLFHSFGLFNVGEGDIANFNNETGLPTTNILGRVTGGEPSSIFGTIRTTNFGAANLFLLNPAGVMFGSTGSLDVGGSFHVSTADYLKLADGAKFHADLTRQSVLTSAPVAAFGFLSQSPAEISIQETILEVPEGQTFSVVGGDIRMKGDRDTDGLPVYSAILAPAGRIQLASVASPGEIPTNVADVSLSDFQRVGEMVLSNSAVLFATGNTSGTVVIRGGKLVLDSASILVDNLGDIDASGRGIDVAVKGDVTIVNNSSLTTESFGAGHASDLQIVADTVEVDNGMVFSSTSASGNSGNVTLNVGNLALKGSIASITLGTGKAGMVTVIAADTIKLDRMNSEIGSLSFISTGDTGDVIVQAKNLAVMGAALIRTGAFEGGNAGDVKVTATDGITLDGANSTIASLSGLIGPTGNSGDVLVQSNNITVTGGALIHSAAAGSGNGGNVVVKATDTLTVDGVRSSISSSATTGDSGDIGVDANNVRVTGGAAIVSLTIGPENVPSGKGGNVTVLADQSIFISGQETGIASGSNGEPGAIFLRAPEVTILDGGGVGTPSSDVLPLGRAGSTTIHADKLTLQGGKITTDSSTESAGGNITIHVGQLALTDGGTITSSSRSSGNAGNIVVQAKEFQSVNSSITTQAETADGGNIDLTVGKLMDLFNSQITTSVQSGVGAGGNITMDSELVALNNSLVLANAFGGPGGNINVTADIFLTNRSVVDASSALGIPGTVAIDATVTDLSGTVRQLPESVLQASTLLRASCAARLAGGKTSSLVLGGRDGLPLEPGGLLPSPLYLSGETNARAESDFNGDARGSRFKLIKSNEESTPALFLETARAALNAGCSPSNYNSGR